MDSKFSCEFKKEAVELLKSSDKKSLKIVNGLGINRDNLLRWKREFADEERDSFLHSLKIEEVFFHKYRTRDEAKKSIFRYIEVFYNRKRKHSYLGYKSLEIFERIGIQKTA